MFRFLFMLSVVVTLSLRADPKWDIEAQLSVKTISDVQIAPDQQTVLFVETESSSDGKQYVSTIYSNKAGKVAQFSPNEFSCFQPRWSPDGKWVAFLALQDGLRQLYLARDNGQSPFVLIKGSYDVQTFAWSPDNQKIAYVMTDKKENGEEINRLWLLDVFLKTPPKALTDDHFCVRGNGDFGTTNVEFDWSKDSQSIVFAYSPKIDFDSFYLDSSIAIVDVQNGQIQRWKNLTEFEAMPRFSPSGNKVAYVANEKGPQYCLFRHLALRNPDGKRYRRLSPTPDGGAFLAGPNFLGWMSDGDLVYFEPKGTKLHLVLVPTDGSRAEPLETGNLLIRDPSLSHDGKFIGFVGQKTDLPPEAFVSPLENFQPRKISSSNEELLKYHKTRTEKISWNSSDDLEIEGLLTYPVDYQGDKKYPLLVVIHGGPMAFFDESFVGNPGYYPLATFAENGFFVLRANPRGSCGYGKEFRSLNFKDWGGMDFIDIMSGVNALIRKDLVDEEKMGVMGWSYGGYLTAWTITQTNRFQAASMGAGLSDLITMDSTTDLNRFLTDYLGKLEENRKLYIDRSPVTHVAQVTTPCLIQHGTSDKRVPVEQGEEFYKALQENGKITKLTLYPDMGHRFSSPKMLEEAMRENLEWFGSYLKD